MENGKKQRVYRVDQHVKIRKRRRLRFLLLGVMTLLLAGAYFLDRAVTLRAGEDDPPPAAGPSELVDAGAPPALPEPQVNAGPVAATDPIPAPTPTNLPTLPPTPEPTGEPLRLTGWAASALAGQTRTVPYGTPLGALGLPGSLEAEMAGEYAGGERPETLDVPVLWIASPDYDPQHAQTYVFTAQPEEGDAEGGPDWVALTSGLPPAQRWITVLQAPSQALTPEPTEAPTAAPTEAPTEGPTPEPTEAPTKAPTKAPEADDSFFTPVPTDTPAPTPKPTGTPLPTVSPAPTLIPNPKVILEIVPLPKEAQRLAVEEGTPVEALGLPETLAVLLAAPGEEAGWEDGPVASGTEPRWEEIPVEWQAEPPYAAGAEDPPADYVFVPIFGVGYTLDEAAVLPEIFLTLLSPEGGMGEDNVFDDGVLRYTVRHEDAETKTGTVSVEALDPERLTGTLQVPERAEARGYTYTVTFITSAGFQGAAGIERLELPASIVRIGRGAFADCDGLAELDTAITDLTDVQPNAFTEAQKAQVWVTCPLSAEDAYTEYGFAHVNAGVYPGISADAPVIDRGVDVCLDIDLGGAPMMALPADILTLREGVELVSFRHEAGQATATAEVRLVADGPLEAAIPAGAYTLDGMPNAPATLYLPQGPLAYTRTGPETAEVSARDSGIGGEIVVPGGIRRDGMTLRVTQVAYAGFRHTAITGIELPDTIESIATCAFQGCAQLKKVTFQEVERIGGYAFAGCSSLAVIDSGIRDLSGVRPAAFPARVREEALVRCDLGVAHLYYNYGFRRIRPEAFAPKLSTQAQGIQPGKAFDIVIDLGCAPEAGLTGDILAVEGGRVVDFYYAPYRRDEENLTRGHATTILATAKILPEEETVRVTLPAGAFTFYETENSAAKALTLHKPEPAVERLAVLPVRLSHTGGTVTVTIAGVSLEGHTLALLLDGEEAQSLAANRDVTVLTLTLAENQETEEKTHTLALLMDGEDTGFTQEIRLAAKPPAQVTGLDIDPQQLTEGGGTVTLSVAGDGLLGADSVGVSVNGEQTQVLAVLSDRLAEAAFALPQNTGAFPRSYAFTALLDDVATPYIRSVTVAAPGGERKDTPEYQYIHSYGPDGLVTYSADATLALSGEGSVYALDVPTGGDVQCFGLSLRMLEELLAGDETGEGALELVGAAYRLRIPLRLLERQQTPKARANMEPAKRLQGLEDLVIDHLRLRVAVKRAGDGYDVTLSLHREDQAEPVPGLTLPRLGHPLVLLAPDGGTWVQVQQSGHYAVEW